MSKRILPSVTTFFTAIAVALISAAASRAEIKVVIERNEDGGAGFAFKDVPPPSKNDAASGAKFVLVGGVRDGNGGELDGLHDGKAPMEEDEPDKNFFFRAGTDGGRVMVDLGSAIAVKQVNSYSWHPGARGPQVYALYGSDGATAGFNSEPKSDMEPEKCGWRLAAKVDSRVKYKLEGGQYGVSVSDTEGVIGKYRYLLFVISQTENQDGFGNTFYSEIDVVDRDAKEAPQPVTMLPTGTTNLSKTFEAGDGKYQIVIDPSNAPDLAEWAFTELAPAAQEWYPKLVKMLPSDGFEAPTKVTIDFGKGLSGAVAVTRGTHITCNSGWVRRNLQGEAKGSVVHELVHVVQHYGGGRARQSNATRAPGWLTEGIPDYIRFYLYEPQTHGAVIRPNAVAKAHYDASYRTTANFLNWVTTKYDKELVPQLNVVLREGKYNADIWKEHTGHTVEELGEEWKRSLEAKVE